MSRVDDRIRREMHGLTRPVDGRAAMERIARRKSRRHIVRRVNVVVLAVVVVTGTVAGTYGLFRAFGARDGRTPGSGGSGGPTVGPSEGTAPATALCNVSELTADLNGDGTTDFAEISAPASEPGITCDQASSLGPYAAYVETDVGLDTARSFTQELPECEQAYACGVFAAPDLDGDGAAEMAIRIAEGATTVTFALYRFEEDGSGEPGLVRFEVTQPGDRWNQEYALRPGPATFLWYGSTGHMHWLSCNEDPEHRPTVVTAIWAEDGYHVHGARLGVEGTTLTVRSTWDEVVPDDRLDVPTDVCGAAIAPPS